MEGANELARPENTLPLPICVLRTYSRQEAGTPLLYIARVLSLSKSQNPTPKSAPETPSPYLGSAMIGFGP